MDLVSGFYTGLVYEVSRGYGRCIVYKIVYFEKRWFIKGVIKCYKGYKRGRERFYILVKLSRFIY